MGRVLLTIETDASSVHRTFGEIREESRTVAASIRGDFQRLADVLADPFRRMRREVAAAAAAVRREEERSTQAAQDGARRRTTIAQGEAHYRKSSAQETAREHERAEERATAVTTRESRRRVNQAEREAREIRAQARRERAESIRRTERTVSTGLQAGGSILGSVHEELQNARQRAAAPQHTLNSAFYQAGVGAVEGERMRASIQRELTDRNGSLRGLTMEEVAGAISGAQTQFSVLSRTDAQRRAGMSEEDARRTNLNRQIGLMAFARDTYQAPAEVLRVAGMLGQQGIQGEDQMAVLRSLTGMAQAGSIELSTLTSTALGPLMQNIARSVTGDMNASQRSAAVRNAVTETMAVGELGAAAGLTPRDALQALAKTRGSLTSSTTAQRLDARLRSGGHADLADQLIERGANGRMSFRDQSPVTLMSRLIAGYGGDANAVTNLLSAGGPGSPMVLDSQQRRLILAMASQTEGGGTIAQKVNAMRAQGEAFDETAVARGRDLRNQESQTALNVQQERNTIELTKNTTGLTGLSNQFAQWRAENPLAAAAAPTALGFLGKALGVGGSTIAVSTASMVNSGRTAATGRDLFGNEVGGARRLLSGTMLGAFATGETGQQLGNQIARAIVDSFRTNPLTAEVSPHAAVHADTTRSTRSQASP